MGIWKEEYMDLLKGNNLFYGILEKLRRFLRPIFYNGSSLNLEDNGLAKYVEDDLVELNEF